LWLAFLQSGVHPTIAGVLLAMTIPTRSPANMRLLLTQVASLLRTMELPQEWKRQVGLEGRQQAEVGVLETVVQRLQSPAQHLEHVLHPWTTYLVLPIFALANAGVSITSDALGNLFNPIGLGIILGLVLGKPLGITLFSWLAMRLGLAVRPPGVSWSLLVGAGALAGIGFTISLFIANAASFPDAATRDAAKLAILVASVLAAVIGATLVTLSTKRLAYREATQLET
jgi:NhaA family Na+:H+ antiporter